MPYLKVSDDIKAQMLASVESAPAEKAKTKEMNVEKGRSREIPMHESGSGTGNPSHKASFTFPLRIPLDLFLRL
jgi:hypothetical protein